MRVMVLVKATDDSETGVMPAPEMFEAMGRFNQELVNANVLLAGDGLTPSSRGKRIAFDGASRTVIDGPFAETRELVAGFWIWQVKDLDEAIAWVKRCPNPMPGPSDIEIRPLFEMADFADTLTPEFQGAPGKLARPAQRQTWPGGRFRRPGNVSEALDHRNHLVARNLFSKVVRNFFRGSHATAEADRGRFDQVSALQGPAATSRHEAAADMGA